MPQHKPTVMTFSHETKTKGRSAKGNTVLYKRSLFQCLSCNTRTERLSNVVKNKVIVCNGIVQLVLTQVQYDKLCQGDTKVELLKDTV